MIRKILHYFRCEWGEPIECTRLWSGVCFGTLYSKIKFTYIKRTCKICGKQEFK